MAMLFAATYPERTIALILFGTESDYTARRGRPTLVEGHEYLATSTRSGARRSTPAGDPRMGGAEPRRRRAAGRLACFVHAAGGEPGGGDRARAHEPPDRRDPRACARSTSRPSSSRARRPDFPSRCRQSPRRSRERGTSSSRATTTSSGWATRSRCSTRSSGSWPSSATRRPSSSGSSPPCSSPTSSDRRNEPSELGDRRWKELVETHHARVRGQPLATGAGRSTRRATVLRDLRRPRPRRSAARVAIVGVGARSRARDPGGPAHRRVRVIGDKVGGIAVAHRRARRCARRPVRGVGLPDREGPRGGLRPRVRGRGRARAEGRARPLAPVPGGEVGHFARPGTRGPSESRGDLWSVAVTCASCAYEKSADDARFCAGCGAPLGTDLLGARHAGAARWAVLLQLRHADARCRPDRGAGRGASRRRRSRSPTSPGSRSRRIMPIPRTCAAR